MSSAFVQAAIILLREGLEAMLVIAALAGYLTKVGAGHRIKALYGGALVAVERDRVDPVRAGPAGGAREGGFPLRRGRDGELLE